MAKSVREESTAYCAFYVVELLFFLFVNDLHSPTLPLYNTFVRRICICIYNIYNIYLCTPREICGK